MHTTHLGTFKMIQDIYIMKQIFTLLSPAKYLESVLILTGR